jgi:DNA polymerase
MLIGEAPGATEDELMRPFVGRSGRLLNQALLAAGTEREKTYITNIVKVRPPNNRKPFPDEIKKGRDLLLKQIAIIKPNVICTLGASALEGLLENNHAITGLRGKPLPFHGITLIPTFHPAYILRDPNRLHFFIHDLTYAVEQAAAK